MSNRWSSRQSLFRQDLQTLWIESREWHCCPSTLNAESASTADVLEGTDSEVIDSFLTLLPSLAIVEERVSLAVGIWSFESGTSGTYSYIHSSFLDGERYFRTRWKNQPNGLDQNDQDSAAGSSMSWLSKSLIRIPARSCAVWIGSTPLRLHAGKQTLEKKG